MFLERLGPGYPYPELRKLSSRWFSERIDQGPVDLKQGAIELLVLLDALEVPVGLCTSTGRKTVEKSLAHLKFEKYLSLQIIRICRMTPSTPCSARAALAFVQSF